MGQRHDPKPQPPPLHEIREPFNPLIVLPVVVFILAAVLAIAGWAW